LIRRVVCFTAASIFLGIVVFALVSPRLDLPWSVFIFAGILGGMFVWWGIFGAGNARTFSDDKPVHNERKKRYGWD
jgi:hypothetical protein